MPICPFCDHKNPATAERCKNCGAWLPEQPDRTEPGQTDGPADQPALDPQEFEEQLLTLLRQGQKIPAIKLYRQMTGTGLKEAKEAVEALAAKHGIQVRATGCAGAACLLLACGAALVWLAWWT